MAQQQKASEINLFDFSDYREFLKSLFEAKKAENSKFSLNYFSRIIDTSDAYLKLVLLSKRGLNLDKATLLAKKLGFSSTETSFFLTLVLADSAKSKDLQLYYTSVLNALKEKKCLPYETENLISIFRDSLTWELYSLVGLATFRDDSPWISQQLRNRKADSSRIKATLQFLIDLGAVKKEGERLKATDVILKSNLSLRHIYSLALERAQEHLEDFYDPTKDIFTSFCLILSNEAKKEIQNILEETKLHIAAAVKKSKCKETVCHLNISLYDVIHTKTKP
jgi:uncharacterized protein (TIGR02147 family)